MYWPVAQADHQFRACTRAIELVGVMAFLQLWSQDCPQTECCRALRDAGRESSVVAA